MIIKTTLEELQRVLNVVNSVVSDKMLNDDMKTITICKNGDEFSAVAQSSYVSVMTKLDATYTTGVDEEDVAEVTLQFKAVELKNILATYTGLHMTVVTGVNFDIRQDEIRLEVCEEAVDKSSEFSAQYNRVTKHRIAKTRVTENVKREILSFKETLNEPENFITLNSKEVLGYIETLLPAISKVTGDTPFTRMYVLPSSIFVIPQTYAAIIENRMDDAVKEQFSKFILTCNVATFLKSFFNLSDTVEFRKKIVKDLVILVLKIGDTAAQVRVTSDKRVPSITDFNVKPDNFISIDRGYFSDVIKRIKNVGIDVTFKVVIDENGVSSCTIMNKLLTQEIPIYKAKGSGEFAFTIKADMLAAITLNNTVGCFGDRLVFRFDEDDKNKVNFYVQDNTNGWHTKMRGLALIESDFKQWN